MNEELLRDLEEGPDRLAAEIDELTESELVRRPPDGGWNLKELTGHLRDIEQFVGIERISMILEQDNPAVPVFNVEEHARNSSAEHQPIGETLSEWRNLREQTVALLRGLDADTLRRTGQHPELGELTPVKIAELLVRHDAEHQAQALELKGMSRAPSS
ncbi:MAG: DinB family protein [Chloroflexota bacterium]|nr:DinB family protein [Chloroflexota bacterium]